MLVFINYYTVNVRNCTLFWVLMAEILNISNKNTLMMFLDYHYCFLLQFTAIYMLQMEEEKRLNIVILFWNILHICYCLQVRLLNPSTMHRYTYYTPVGSYSSQLQSSVRACRLHISYNTVFIQIIHSPKLQCKWF